MPVCVRKRTSAGSTHPDADDLLVLSGRRSRAAGAWARRVGAAAAAMLLTAALCRCARGDQWPGWRGQDREGRSRATTAPLHWGPDRNVVWKTGIPGQGHSSPALTEDAVYVTTAYTTESGTAAMAALDYVCLACLFALVWYILHHVVRSCGDLELNRQGLRKVLTMTGLWLLVGMLAGFVLLGERFLDLERCDIRKWITSSIFATTCLALCVLAGRAGPRMNLVLGLLALFFGPVVALGIPSKAHAYRGAPFSRNAAVVLTVSALPVLLGMVLIARYLSGRHRRTRAAEAPRPPRAPSRLIRALKYLSLVFGAGVLVALARTLFGRNIYASYLIGSPYKPVLPWWAVGPAAGALGAALLARRAAGNRVWANLAVQVAAVALALVTLATLAEHLIALSPYLTYHYGSPRIELPLGWQAAAALGGFCLLWMLALAFLESRLQSHCRGIGDLSRHAARTKLLWSLGFRATAILLAVMLLPYLAYRPGGQRIQPLLGWPAAAGLAGFCLLCLLHLAIFESRPRARTRRMWSAGLGVTAVLLAGAYFLRLNFLSGKEEFVRNILCIDRHSGAIRWACEALRGPRGRIHKENSAATPTPVVDAERVYAYFGTIGLACADHSGKLLWTCTDLPYDTVYGVATSPVLWDGKLILAAESEAGSYVAAVDCATGKPAWKRDMGRPKEKFGIHRTPLVRRVVGRDTLLAWGKEELTGYDPSSGEELWRLPVEYVGGDGIASMVSDDKRLYLAGTEKVLALWVDKLGTAADPLAWRQTLPGPNRSSPVLAGDLLFMASDGGRAFCLDAADGTVLWRKRLKGKHYASPVVIGDRVYFFGSEGHATVVARERAFRVLAESDLGELTFASAAPVDGMLFVRTGGRLYCLGEPKALSGTAQAKAPHEE